MVRISMSREDRVENERLLVNACIENVKRWARENLATSSDVQAVESEDVSAAGISEEAMDLCDRIAKLKYHGVKECKSDYCTTKSPVEGSYFLPVLEFSGARNDANRDIDGLSKYCDNCSDILPVNGLIDGWELSRYVQYAMHIKKIYDKRNDPGRYQSVHSLNREAYLSDQDLEKQNRLRFLENGVKRCKGKFCARRNELGVVEDIVDLKDFPKDSKSPDGLGSVCKECLSKKYMESKEYRRAKERADQEERFEMIRLIKSHPNYQDPLAKVFPDVMKETYQCGKCFEYMGSDEFPAYKVSMSSRGYKVCKKCRAASARRANLAAGSEDSGANVYKAGDTVNRKNVFHFMMSNGIVKKFFSRYAIDVNRGIIVHRQAERLGSVVRAPGDEAYSVNTNREKAIVIESGSKPVLAKLVLSVLYDLTDPRGTVVLRNRDSMDLRPCNVAQWHAEDPDSPIDRSVKPRKVDLHAAGESRRANQEIVKIASGKVKSDGEPLEWFSSCSLYGPVSSFSTEIKGEFDGISDLVDTLDGFRRSNARICNYIWACDTSYLKHIQDSVTSLHETDSRPLYSLKGRDISQTLSGRLYRQIVDAVELASIK